MRNSASPNTIALGEYEQLGVVEYRQKRVVPRYGEHLGWLVGRIFGEVTKELVGNYVERRLALVLHGVLVTQANEKS